MRVIIVIGLKMRYDIFPGMCLKLNWYIFAAPCIRAIWFLVTDTYFVRLMAFAVKRS